MPPPPSCGRVGYPKPGLALRPSRRWRASRMRERGALRPKALVVDRCPGQDQPPDTSPTLGRDRSSSVLQLDDPSDDGPLHTVLPPPPPPFLCRSLQQCSHNRRTLQAIQCRPPCASSAYSVTGEASRCICERPQVRRAILAKTPSRRATRRGREAPRATCPRRRTKAAGSRPGLSAHPLQARRGSNGIRRICKREGKRRDLKNESSLRPQPLLGHPAGAFVRLSGEGSSRWLVLGRFSSLLQKAPLG